MLTSKGGGAKEEVLTSKGGGAKEEVLTSKGGGTLTFVQAHRQQVSHAVEWRGGGQGAGGVAVGYWSGPPAGPSPEGGPPAGSGADAPPPPFL